MKTHTSRYFTHAHNIEGCLRNASFVAERFHKRTPHRTWLVQYINGDYMGEIAAVPGGMVEVDRNTVERLLPIGWS